jgi:plastocyanin
MNLARTLALGVIGMLVAAAIAVSPARAADTEVKIDNFTFNPQQITVKAGTTVVWLNHDDIPHTVTSSTQAFKSKALDTDDKFSYTFATPGTFKYFCALHPHMTGTIVVEASAGQ